MIHLNVCSSSAPAILSLTVLAATSLVDAKKIDAKIDLAVVTPVSLSQEGTNQMKDALRTLPQIHFEMGEQKVKVAIVTTLGNNATILQLLTSNETAFANALDGWTLPESYAFHFGQAFAAIREEIFDFSNEKRAKAVIAFINYFPASRLHAAQEAKALREKGALIYVIFDRDVVDNDGVGLRKDAEDIAGNQTNTIGIPGQDFYKDVLHSISEVKPRMLRDLCFWTTSCHYENAQREVCESEAWRPSNKPSYFDDDGAQCLAVRPNDTACTLDDCVKECDERWEWEGPLPDCNKTCGAVVKRKTDTPPEKLENCVAEFKCHPCPNATTTLTPNTTVPPVDPLVLDPKAPTDGKGETQRWLIPVIVGTIVVALIVVGVVVLVVIRKKRTVASAKAVEERRKKKTATKAVSKPRVREHEVAIVAKQAGADASVAADVSAVGKTMKFSIKPDERSMTPLSKQLRGESVVSVSKKAPTLKNTPRLKK